MCVHVYMFVVGVQLIIPLLSSLCVCSSLVVSQLSWRSPTTGENTKTILVNLQRKRKTKQNKKIIRKKRKNKLQHISHITPHREDDWQSIIAQRKMSQENMAKSCWLVNMYSGENRNSSTRFLIFFFSIRFFLCAYSTSKCSCNSTLSYFMYEEAKKQSVKLMQLSAKVSDVCWTVSHT